MLTTATWATIVAVLKPFVEMFLSTFGQAVNDWLAAKRSEQAQRDLGTVTAERDQAQAANAAKDAELRAQANAPADVDDAISRLESGNA